MYERFRDKESRSKNHFTRLLREAWHIVAKSVSESDAADSIPTPQGDRQA